MEIVKDKVAAVQKAADISDILMRELFTQLKSYQCEDDPAENIYLIAHVLGRMLFVVSNSIEQFGETYQIKINKKIFLKWINEIVKETQLIGKKLND